MAAPGRPAAASGALRRCSDFRAEILKRAAGGAGDVVDIVDSQRKRMPQPVGENRGQARQQASRTSGPTGSPLVSTCSRPDENGGAIIPH